MYIVDNKMVIMMVIMIELVFIMIHDFISMYNIVDVETNDVFFIDDREMFVIRFYLI